MSKISVNYDFAGYISTEVQGTIKSLSTVSLMEPNEVLLKTPLISLLPIVARRLFQSYGLVQVMSIHTILLFGKQTGMNVICLSTNSSKTFKRNGVKLIGLKALA